MPRNPWTKAADAELQRLCAEGASTKTIGRELGRAPTAVDRRISFLRENGVDMPRRGNPTDSDVDETVWAAACNLHLQDLMRAHSERQSEVS